jgi:aminomethyltransferase
MVSFAGWDMPVEYTGIPDEHMAVRTQAGLFDVSHMGEVEIAGTDALEAVQRISCNDASRLEIGQVQYSVLTTHEGTAIDDLLVYRLAVDHYLLVINAANVSKDIKWIREEIKVVDDAVAVNSSSRYSLLALQGPCAREVLQPLTGVDLNAIRYYWFDTGEVANVRATISRTGYTGEDGFELFVPPQSVGHVWDTILTVGLAAGVKPIGLGARDTLRLEASMRLYGNDMDESTTVLEAGLGWVVGWNKPSFNGRDVLTAQKSTGVSRKLVGFEMLERGIARHGYEVYVDGQKVGAVTSGTQTPHLKKSIGMAYMPIGSSEVGVNFRIKIRERLVAARVIKMPFYIRESS